MEWKRKRISKNGELEFEGEYLNGNRWNGKGKEYNDNGELIFEGKYINGKKIEKERIENYINGKIKKLII